MAWPTLDEMVDSPYRDAGWSLRLLASNGRLACDYGSVVQ